MYKSTKYKLVEFFKIILKTAKFAHIFENQASRKWNKVCIKSRNYFNYVIFSTKYYIQYNKMETFVRNIEKIFFTKNLVMFIYLNNQLVFNIHIN